MGSEQLTIELRPTTSGWGTTVEVSAREALTMEAKNVREAIRFGHTDAEKRVRAFDERCERAGWGRSIADRLFRLLHSTPPDPAAKILLRALSALVAKLRYASSVWRAPVRRAIERLASVPEAAGILPFFEAERDARVRSEEAEESKARAEAEKKGEYFFKEFLGVETLAEARALPAEFVRDKELEYRAKVGFGGTFNSVVDGKFLTKEIEGYLMKDQLHRVPILLGWTGDEFIFGPRGDDDEAFDKFAATFGDKEAEYRALVEKEVAAGKDRRTAGSANLNETAARIVGDVFNEQGRSIRLYCFDPEIPGDDAGSFHSSDLWFCFETLMKCWRPFDGHHFDLARKMCNYWTNFAKTGDPNGNDADGTPMPEWKAYTPDNRRCIQFFDTVQMQPEETPACTDFIVKINLEAYRENNQ